MKFLWIRFSYLMKFLVYIGSFSDSEFVFEFFVRNFPVQIGAYIHVGRMKSCRYLIAQVGLLLCDYFCVFVYERNRQYEEQHFR
jgi:hypothetical protein